MFRLSADITVGPFKGFKPAECRWERSLDNYADYATFTIPAICVIKGGQADANALRGKMPTHTAIKEGMPVEIWAGYDGNNSLRFSGFITRINYRTPLVVECEGWIFKMRTVILKKVYTNTTLKAIVQDLTAGTGIETDEGIPDVQIAHADLRNYTGVQALDWLKEKMLLTVYFKQNKIYAGLRYTGNYGQVIAHRIGWNVVSDEELTSRSYTPAVVKINLQVRQQDGPVAETAAGAAAVKDVRVYGYTPGNTFISQLQADIQAKEQLKGLEGRITAFLHPAVDLNMGSDISDGQFAEKKGRYLIEAIAGSVSRSGGRQVITLGVQV